MFRNSITNFQITQEQKEVKRNSLSISNNENENTVDGYLTDTVEQCHWKIYCTK